MTDTAGPSKLESDIRSILLPHVVHDAVVEDQRDVAQRNLYEVLKQLGAANQLIAELRAGQPTDAGHSESGRAWEGPDRTDAALAEIQRTLVNLHPWLPLSTAIDVVTRMRMDCRRGAPTTEWSRP